MSEVDRVTGLVGYSGVKVPVLAASTAALILSAEQTVDGVALITGDRVLVKNQASSVDNGIYVVDSGDWERAADADGSYDFRKGSLVFVYGGTVNGNKVFKCTSADPIVVDTDALTFVAMAVELTGSSKTIWAGTATGTANALILTPATAVAAGDLVPGLAIVFKAGAAPNSAPTTIAVSGNAAIAVQNDGAAMVGGEILAGKWYRATLDGTGAAFQLEHLVPLGSTSAFIAAAMLTTKGDIIVATAASTPARLGVGAAGTTLMSRPGAASGLAYVAALTKGIWGWAYQNNAGDPTNDIDFPVGGGMDSTGAYWHTGAAMTKQLDANWAPGTNQGMRNSAAAITNADYYLWAVAKADGSAEDYYAHTSTTAATVLAALQAEVGGAAYAYLRLMGYIKRSGGTIVAFHTYETAGGGLDFFWDSPTTDINLANTLTTTRRTDAVKVPLLFSTIAHLNVALVDASSGQTSWIYCPDQADLAPSSDGTTTPLANGNTITTVITLRQLFVRTSATGTIAARSTLATVDQYSAVTNGFHWARRN